MGFCIVRGCKSRSDCNNRGTKFHVMPRNIVMREKWIVAIGRSDIPRSGSVCSKHFLPEDYQPSRSGFSESLLKTSIPSQNLFPTVDIEDGDDVEIFDEENNDDSLNEFYSTMDFENESTTFDEFTETINNLELEKEKDLPALTCVDLFPDPPHLIESTDKVELEGSLADDDEFPGFKSAESKSEENQTETKDDSVKMSPNSDTEKDLPSDPILSSQTDPQSEEQLKTSTTGTATVASAPVSPSSYFSSAESVASTASSSKKSKKRHCRQCDINFRKTRELHEHLKQHVTMPDIRIERLSDDHEKVKEYLSSLNPKLSPTHGSLKMKFKILSSQNFEVVPSEKPEKPVMSDESRIRVLKAADIKCKPELSENTPLDPFAQNISSKLPNSFLAPENRYFECPTFDGLDNFVDEMNNIPEATEDLLKKLLENNKEPQVCPKEADWPSNANEYISIDSLAPRCNVCHINFSHPKYLYEHKQITGHDFPNRMPDSRSLPPNAQPDYRQHPGQNNFMHGPPHPSQNMPPLYQLAQMRGNFPGYGPRMNVRQVMHHHPQPSPPPGFHPQMTQQCMMTRTPPPLYRVNGNPANYPPGHFIEKGPGIYNPGPAPGPGPGPQFHNSNPQQHNNPQQHCNQQQQQQQQQHQQQQHQQQLQQQQHQQQLQQQHSNQQQPGQDMMRQPIFLKSRLQKAIRGRSQGPPSESPTPPGILSEQTAIRPRFLGANNQMSSQMSAQMQYHQRPHMQAPPRQGEPPNKRVKIEPSQFQSQSCASTNGIVSPGISNSPGMPIIQSVHSGINPSNFPQMNEKSKSTPPRQTSPLAKGPTKNPKDVANILANRGITVTHKGKASVVPVSNKGANSATAAQEAVQKLQANNSVSIISKKKPIEINVTKVPTAAIPEANTRITAKFLSCPVITCKEKFLTNEGVNRHAFRWHGIPMPNGDRIQKRFISRCRVCHHLCPTPEALQEHMRREHEPAVNEIGIPIVDLRNDEVKRKLAGLGIFNYVPLTAAGASTSSLAFPVVSVQGTSNPSICNLLGLGASAVLSLGPVKSIAIRKPNNDNK